MDLFDRIKEKLFGETVERSGQLHHGPLERGEAFLSRYKIWQPSTEKQELLGYFTELLALELQRGNTDLHLYSSEQATGIQFKRPANAVPEALNFLLEEFKEHVIEIGYRVHLSDHRISAEGVHRERYYLKPSIPSNELKPPLPQHFGNVALEVWGEDAGKAEHLKVMITVYSDRLYLPAESGMSLIKSLLTGRGRAFN